MRLRRSRPDGPGFSRRKRGSGFIYLDTEGKTIKDTDVVERIRTLAIPPAWTDVWICPISNGHLQATGRDAKGRKVYRYHPRFRAARDELKYGHLIAFARVLRRIRKRVDHDLSLPGLPREKVIAAVVALLDQTHIRVGNEEYTRANGSFGLTTLRNKHVRVKGSAVQLRFRGKSGKEHQIGLSDRRLARVVKRCQDLPGQLLFQYINGDGVAHRVESGDVNDYLREAAGEDVTAKDFRTWAGTVLAATALDACGCAATETEAKRLIVSSIDATAAGLGNTRAVCRASYIHPVVFEAYQSGTLLSGVRPTRRPSGLSVAEARVLELLLQREKRLALVS